MLQEELNFPESGMQFSEFDREFGEFLLRQSGQSSPGLLYAGMLVAFELRAGRCSLELAKYAGKSLLCSSGQLIRIPEYDQWYAELTAPENREIIAPDYSPGGRSLLVMPRPGELMLRRYADFENCVREALFSRRSFAAVPEFFQMEVNDSPDLQDLAVFTGINSRLLILSGGPGTGKTTVCGRILAELLRRDPGKKIFFAAPTGKAQKRMAEQIKESAMESKRKLRFFFIFNEEITFKEHMLRYLELKEVFDMDLALRLRKKLDIKLKKQQEKLVKKLRKKKL